MLAVALDIALHTAEPRVAYKTIVAVRFGARTAYPIMALRPHRGIRIEALASGIGIALPALAVVAALEALSHRLAQFVAWQAVPDAVVVHPAGHALPAPGLAFRVATASAADVFGTKIGADHAVGALLALPGLRIARGALSTLRLALGVLRAPGVAPPLPVHLPADLIPLAFAYASAALAVLALANGPACSPVSLPIALGVVASSNVLVARLAILAVRHAHVRGRALVALALAFRQVAIRALHALPLAVCGRHAHQVGTTVGIPPAHVASLIRIALLAGRARRGLARTADRVADTAAFRAVLIRSAVHALARLVIRFALAVLWGALVVVQTAVHPLALPIVIRLASPTAAVALASRAIVIRDAFSALAAVVAKTRVWRDLAALVPVRDARLVFAAVTLARRGVERAAVAAVAGLALARIFIFFFFAGSRAFAAAHAACAFGGLARALDRHRPQRRLGRDAAAAIAVAVAATCRVAADGAASALRRSAAGAHALAARVLARREIVRALALTLVGTRVARAVSGTVCPARRELSVLARAAGVFAGQLAVRGLHLLAVLAAVARVDLLAVLLFDLRARTGTARATAVVALLASPREVCPALSVRALAAAGLVPAWLVLHGLRFRALAARARAAATVALLVVLRFIGNASDPAAFAALAVALSNAADVVLVLLVRLAFAGVAAHAAYAVAAHQALHARIRNAITVLAHATAILAHRLLVVRLARRALALAAAPVALRIVTDRLALQAAALSAAACPAIRAGLAVVGNTVSGTALSAAAVAARRVVLAPVGLAEPVVAGRAPAGPARLALLAFGHGACGALARAAAAVALLPGLLVVRRALAARADAAAAAVGTARGAVLG